MSLLVDRQIHSKTPCVMPCQLCYHISGETLRRNELEPTSGSHVCLPSINPGPPALWNCEAEQTFYKPADSILEMCAGRSSVEMRHCRRQRARRSFRIGLAALTNMSAVSAYLLRRMNECLLLEITNREISSTCERFTIKFCIFLLLLRPLIQPNPDRPNLIGLCILERKRTSEVGMHERTERSSSCERFSIITGKIFGGTAENGPCEVAPSER